MTALQCLLDKFAIIAVHGLGLVIVEYGDKEYLKHSLKVSKQYFSFFFRKLV